MSRDAFGARWGLTLPLCGLHFVFFFLTVMDPQKAYGIFAFVPGRALLAPWTFFTYQFLHSGPLSLFFGALGLFVLGSALEAEWGTTEFTFFWVVATLGGSVSAWILGAPLLTDPFVVPVSMLFAYALLFPDTRFFVFFVIPVKVVWLAYLTAGFLAFAFVKDLLGAGLGTAVVRVAGAAAGFLFFWVRQHGKFKAKKLTAAVVNTARSAAVARADGALEKRNRDLFPKVEALRAASRTGGGLPEDQSRFASDLARLVVPGVKVCKPVDFKGDRDLVCLRCEGFAECSLRYVTGRPDEIVVRDREGE